MNTTFLSGNLTDDPKLVKTQSGISVATFRIGVRRKYKDADGNYQSDFFPIVAWRGLADLIYANVTKGMRVSVVGTLQTRQYDAQDGSKRFITEVVAEECEWAKKSGEGQAPAAPVQAPAPDKFTETVDDELPF